GFERWTPTQQAIFAETLTGLTRDKGRDTPALLRTISQLAALPAVPPARLVQLATHHVPNTALRDAAIRALGRLDAGQGVETLVSSGTRRNVADPGARRRFSRRRARNHGRTHSSGPAHLRDREAAGSDAGDAARAPGTGRPRCDRAAVRPAAGHGPRAIAAVT